MSHSVSTIVDDKTRVEKGLSERRENVFYGPWQARVALFTHGHYFNHLRHQSHTTMDEFTLQLDRHNDVLWLLRYTAYHPPQPAPPGVPCLHPRPPVALVTASTMTFMDVRAGGGRLDGWSSQLAENGELARERSQLSPHHRVFRLCGFIHRARRYLRSDGIGNVNLRLRRTPKRLLCGWNCRITVELSYILDLLYYSLHVWIMEDMVEILT